MTFRRVRWFSKWFTFSLEPLHAGVRESLGVMRVRKNFVTRIIGHFSPACFAGASQSGSNRESLEPLRGLWEIVGFNGSKLNVP